MNMNIWSNSSIKLSSSDTFQLLLWFNATMLDYIGLHSVGMCDSTICAMQAI